MKYLLVDDHSLIREALRGVLKELDDNPAILEASCWRNASRLLEDNSGISLVLLDLGLPDCDGFTALAEIRERYEETSVVILSGSYCRDNVVKAFALGAAGFIPKSGEREVMLGALRLVLSGGLYIPPEILSSSEAPHRLGQSIAADRHSAGPALTSLADIGLTARQVDVLALMMRGKSNKAICRILNLAEPTVRNQVSMILKALKVNNRTEAVIKVGALGWNLPRFDD
jgi:DNA-binding NarL/FixJ family response regulator